MGIIAGVIYLLWMYQRAMLGEINSDRTWADLDCREAVALGLLAIAVLWLGLYPAPFLDSLEIPVATIIESNKAMMAGMVDALR